MSCQQTALASSFRDNAGFMFKHEKRLLRQIHPSYREQFELLISSGLHAKLEADGQIVSHSEVAWPETNANCYKVIAPKVIPFISYPSEWCFSALKSAALLTLEIQERALQHGMILRDASAFNVQFQGARAIFIDTLSFARYSEGSPWVAYRQFCQHFLAPLALMATRDPRLNRLLQVFIDGLPLDIASAMLPFRSYFSPRMLLHIHAHARTSRHFADAARSQQISRAKTAHVSKTSLFGLVDSLKNAVTSLNWQPSGTEWGDYYCDTNYTDSAMGHKRSLISAWIQESGPKVVWDLGSNTGEFSRLAAAHGATVISFDVDPAAVEKNFLREKKTTGTITPLILDLTCPTPSFGWGLEERDSVTARGPANVAMALALVHHLAIGNNIPLERIASFLAKCCETLIIEFVPKSDSQVQRLLASREDIFHNYTKTGFEAAFQLSFKIDKIENIQGSERVLYRMTRLSQY